MVSGERSRLVSKARYAVIHKLSAGMALLAFFVIAAGGLMAEASVMSVTYKTVVAFFVVAIINRVVVKMIESYEEMNRG